MPLEKLPDTFDGATHEQLDKAVNEDEVMVEYLAGTEDLSPPGQKDLLSVILLSVIVRHAREGLDKKYTDSLQSMRLIKTHRELGDMLASAWKSKSYREIRNLAILRAPLSNVAPNRVNPGEPDLYTRLSKSFRMKYHGAAVDGFYEYLKRNERLFESTDKPLYYARFCSIVQSSGTGKSRMLTELCKKGVVVIYMNLRDKTEESGFPIRDQVPSQILTGFPPTQDEYVKVCAAFFTALFNALQAQLPNYDTKEKLMVWVHQICDMSEPPTSTVREVFFRQVSEGYKKARADLEPDEMLKASGVAADETMDKLKRLSISERNARQAEKYAVPHEQELNFSALHNAYRKLASGLRRFFPANTSHPHSPKVVIAIDEAHPLTPKVHNAYRPADVFCRIINRFSQLEDRRHAIWVVFASTTSKVADFSPPNRIHNSDRVARLGERLFQPYTQLGWDQNAYKIGEVDIEHVSRIVHIAGYGRPLWLSLRKTQDVTAVLNLASHKLCSGRFDPTNRDHVLAVLRQRFGLNVTLGHPDAVEYLETGVASHLLICLGTTIDRGWRFTNYPSEPLLAAVAASVLHSGEGSQTLDAALKKLLEVVNLGMIDVGQRGELASRLIWLLAKDLFVRKHGNKVVNPIKWDDPLVDCDMISVVDWLEFIFGQRVWDDDDMQRASAREAFEGAYLNFSHWVCMSANIAGSKDGNELSVNEWTRRHWYRTSAVQCCHQQPRVDKMIPIYFKDGPTGASAGSRMSQILISDKAGQSAHSKDELGYITRRHTSIGGEGTGTTRRSAFLDSDTLPYIAILADLGQPFAFSTTFPERDVGDRCFRIYAAGVDVSTYPFLEKYPGVVQILQDLVLLQQLPNDEMFYMKYLDAQVQFGSKATPDYMVWENSKVVPSQR